MKSPVLICGLISKSLVSPEDWTGEDNMNRAKIVLVLAVAATIAVFFGLGWHQHLSFEAVAASREWLTTLYAEQPVTITLAYFTVYVAIAALSIPGAAVMTLLGGAIFGLTVGTVVVSFASTLGATLAFLFARYLLRDFVQHKFAAYLAPVNRGMEKEGGFYLFAMRLVPALPFFAVNLVAALTPLRLWTYVWVSQLGMLPATIVYVNAGRELGSLQNLSGIVSPAFVISFVALGVLPLLSSRVLAAFRARRVQAGFEKPATFDRNLVVIGAGAAGLVSAYIGAAVKAKVTLIERHRMGGDCLNTGCVPSKALLRSAHLVADMKRAQEFGLAPVEPKVNFAAVMQRVKAVIAAVAPHDSIERYSGLGVDCRIGEARIVSPWCVEVDGEPITTRAIVIAAGARPLVPPIPGLATVHYRTSDTVWELEQLPRRMVVLGGGPIGCELAQCFARLGSKVIIVEMAPALLIREEPELAAQVAASLERDGVDIRLGTRAEAAEGLGDGRGGDEGGRLRCSSGDQSVELGFDVLLVAVGRQPNITGYGLEELGIGAGAGAVVETDDYLATLHPNIYACGDVAGPYQFTHTAAHQAWYAAVNALFGQFKRFRADYRVIPRVTYTYPELASVGIGEREAREQGIPYEVTRYGIDDLDRAIVDGEARGDIKIITSAGSDTILGAHIVASNAGDLIAEFTLAMRHGLGLKKILSTIHAYPTMMEANKYVAGNWQREHAPQKLLSLVERYHAWRLQ